MSVATRDAGYKSSRFKLKIRVGFLIHYPFFMENFMETGKFYFIKDDYFDFFKDQRLMINKGKNHKRPCFFAFKDGNYDIYWLVPLSTRVEKYKRIYNEKVKRNGKCESIYFCKLKEQERAFLIQNMLPVTDEFIDSEYRCYSNNILKLKKNDENMIIIKAKKLLNIQKMGRNVILNSCLEIEKELIKMLNVKNK